jgi:CobQ/CobB/MinD/ParA nucleotide binding domain
MTRYDDALPLVAALVESKLGRKATLENFFLRDASGRLTFVPVSPIDQSSEEEIRREAAKLLPYVDGESGAIASPEDLFDPNLREENVGLPEWIEHKAFRGFVRLVERRIVGQDWLQPPRDPIEGVPPITVFASHKGGVGRSTALAVSAAALSEKGFSVLVVDLDLEAPGLGEMLLNEAPKFGTLDYFVEDGLSNVDDSFFGDLLAPSTIATGGSIHVVPAIGRIGYASPQNVLGKIARAYLEKVGPDGTTETFLERARTLVSQLAARANYDAIFVGVRAGLNEATAAAILGLGADVLLFGVDTCHTLSTS